VHTSRDVSKGKCKIQQQPNLAVIQHTWSKRALSACFYLLWQTLHDIAQIDALRDLYGTTSPYADNLASSDDKHRHCASPTTFVNRLEVRR
jgi:hypothetical protein